MPRDDPNDPRAVPSDRSGVDPVPIQRPPEEGERPEPWRPGLDYVGADGQVTRVPVDLRGTIFDPDTLPAVQAAAPPAVLQPAAPRGNELRRVLPRAFPGVLVGGQDQRPVLQEPPRDLPVTRHELHPDEPAPDDQTRAIIWMCVRWAVLGVGFVAFMVWYNLGRPL